MTAHEDPGSPKALRAKAFGADLAWIAAGAKP